MEVAFYFSGVVAIIATVLTVTRKNTVHALLYLILSLLAIAVVLYTIGAPFIAALEVIIYAGAIMVLFVFVVMMLNLGERAAAMERRWWTSRMWVGPSVLAAVLLAEVIYLLFRASMAPLSGMIEPKQVGIALFGPYLIAAELASMLLLAGVVGAYHVGWREKEKKELEHGASTDERRAVAGRDLVHAGSRGTDRTA